MAMTELDYNDMYVLQLIFWFQLISISPLFKFFSIHYHTPNDGKVKINWHKKWTTTYILKFKMIIQA